MKLKVIQKRIQVNSFSLILEKPRGFIFYAGQYLNMELDGDTRSFTISSSPTEDYLMITTKKSQSKFKKQLFLLKSGDSLSSSYPAGTFTLDEIEPAVFIAGGIGITPFRSMIKHAVDQKLTTPMTLIYSNSDDNFLFKNVLENWKKELSNLDIIYHNSSQNDHIDVAKILTIVGSLANSIYYLAGSHSFVNSMGKILLELGIDQINIRYDRFDGYV